MSSVNYPHRHHQAKIGRSPRLAALALRENIGNSRYRATFWGTTLTADTAGAISILWLALDDVGLELKLLRGVVCHEKFTPRNFNPAHTYSLINLKFVVSRISTLK